MESQKKKKKSYFAWNLNFFQMTVIFFIILENLNIIKIKLLLSSQHYESTWSTYFMKKKIQDIELNYHRKV